MNKKSAIVFLATIGTLFVLLAVLSFFGDDKTRVSSPKKTFTNPEKSLIRDIYNKRSTCNRIETAKWIGEQIFEVKVPGASVTGVREWRQKRDDTYFFDVHYRLNGIKKIGMMAVKKSDCRTVISKDI